MQVPTVAAAGGGGVGEQTIKLTWIQGQPAPECMGSLHEAAVVHGSTAYFSSGCIVYSYTVPENKWTKLPECKYEYFAIAVVNDALTTIGGWDRQWAATNTLFSFFGSTWEEVLPPMPTERLRPAAKNTATHLVVAGGRLARGNIAMATVEVLNTETLQWSTASSLPVTVWYPQMTTLGGCLYLVDDRSNAFSCSVEDLLKSTNSSDGGSVWTRLARIPTPWGSTLATLRGHVLAIGGQDDDWNPTGAIHCYDVATNSWSIISEMPTPKYLVLTAVLPSNELVVVGGYDASGTRSTTSDIGIYSSSQLTF